MFGLVFSVNAQTKIKENVAGNKNIIKPKKLKKGDTVGILAVSGRIKEYKNIDELYVKSRTEGFNFLTKAVILYGSDVLSKHRYDDCYGKALKVRRVVAEKFEELMKSYDAVLTPVCSKTEYAPYDTDDAFAKVFEESIFTAVPSITGLPAMVSGGVQLIADSFKESTLLSIAHTMEKEEA